MNTAGAQREEGSAPDSGRPAREPVRVAVLASGRGSNMEAVLAAQARGDLGAEVVLVVSDKGDAPALEKARAAGVPALWLDPGPWPTRADYDRQLRDVLVAHRVELVVLAGFMRLLSAPMVDAFPNRIINVHPSLLPAFPGLQAPTQALDWGVKVSGCTVHFVDYGMDTGPIILQEAVPVLPEDDPGTLHRRIQAVEHRLLPEAIRLYAQGRLRVEGRRVHVAPPVPEEAEA
ncbi:MAG TPA: phosphoribosylglycinamide formyltransferase [Sphingobacteriaceae bacterium]|nr:phosphoribosylglycinamide formyltransferase [Sphingobacteriaceae bacterium]